MESIELTNNPPKKPGLYYYFDGGEHTPTILKVMTRNATLGERKNPLYAENEELFFKVPLRKNKTDFWAEIPPPSLNGEILEYESY